MSKKKLNDSQIEQINGGGVINYFKGGLKIIAGTALAAGSLAILYGKDNEVPYLSKISDKLGDKKSLGAAIGGVTSAALILDGISQIQDENRAAKISKIK